MELQDRIYFMKTRDTESCSHNAVLDASNYLDASISVGEVSAENVVEGEHVVFVYRHSHGMFAVTGFPAEGVVHYTASCCGTTSSGAESGEESGVVNGAASGVVNGVESGAESGVVNGVEIRAESGVVNVAESGVVNVTKSGVVNGVESGAHTT